YQRLSLHEQRFGANPFSRLDVNLLFRVGSCECRLSHSRRDIPTRDPRARDGFLPCCRHRHPRRYHQSIGFYRSNQSGRESLYSGYLVLSATMIVAALIELLWGPKAEGKPLELVAPPLSLADAKQTEPLPRTSR